MKQNFKSFLESNQAYWDELTEVHCTSPYSAYNIAEFKQGKTTLYPTELRELGNVSGKKLLHLQCHLGLDSLSLVRLGAKVTGVDFSLKAISQARSLSDELAIPATFIHSSISELQYVLNEKFDIVFTSYGVLVWLEDLVTWAKTISHFLKPKGLFYIVDEHPFACVFSGAKDVVGLKPEYPYQNNGVPYITNNMYSYAEDKTKLSNQVQYKWPHSMSEIINCLIQEKLQINYLHEYNFCFYEILSGMKQDADGWWKLVNNERSIPLMFSLMATKTRS